MKHKDVWNRVNLPFDTALMSPAWEEMNAKFISALTPVLPDDFLRLPICESVFSSNGATWIKECLAYTLKSIDDKNLAQMVIRESPHGGPHITVPEYGASDSTIMQVYHIARYMAETGKCFDKATFPTVVELGGGYGNMARMFSEGHTWYIIDIPIMSYLQYFYLTSTIGEERVTLCSGDVMPRLSTVNIIPLPWINKTAGVNADMFLSTFALNECSNKMGDMLKEIKWFDAKSFLIAHWGHYNIDLIKMAHPEAKELPLHGGCPANHLFV